MVRITVTHFCDLETPDKPHINTNPEFFGCGQGIAALAQGCARLEQLVLDDCDSITDVALFHIATKLCEMKWLSLRNFRLESSAWELSLRKCLFARLAFRLGSVP